MPEDRPTLITDSRELIRSDRRITLAVVHCSATRVTQRYSPEQLVRDHLLRGYDGAGYHYYITRDGSLYSLRHVDKEGAHARGYNRYSLGICYEGGLTAKGLPRDTRTPEQRQTLKQLVAELKQLYPDVYVVGHRDLSPDLNGDGDVTPEEWIKMCPCFNAKVLN
ncbi:MAG: N-acetylmuramoyl-L-alanine amidase [Porphyromonas sp.]|nr:N-acetylmuramoyl-L-alanine amidase [Porphyromonas sp.]